ncbi:MAG: deoxyribodipyrimidine photo-lyase [Candidatus Thermochlorobacter aerophilum]|jgi:deoxyribodipyrimidine photo-lyase|uniref:Deoxyribodipyrimidine photo-lyase n=1 Tax=Candidatus Thermochlorobacter aerophilus TaxID=1868324 RepID=A0A395M359_9BACT|nr:MAG: deoxyribodipyrimidine photo-lyase [Candidatus Thermochlorobacter aerophilum]
MNRIIVWHRRDLRIYDNTALNAARKVTKEILPLFIFADDILKERDDFSPACVKFMCESLSELCESYRRIGGKLILRKGKFVEVIKQVVKETEARAVYFNEDYEPAAKERDKKVTEELRKMGVEVKAFKDQVCFSPKEILTQQGRPYTVFTPYKKNWLSQIDKVPSPNDSVRDIVTPDIFSISVPTLSELGLTFEGNLLVKGGERHGRAQFQHFLENKIRYYKEKRDFPSDDGTSLLSAHLRFGTISVREIIDKSRKELDKAEGKERDGIETFISEIIWRDFYFQILDHFPHVEKESFKPEYRALSWENREDYFEAWKNGRTGFPIVDAAMRQLNQTGWMHNRLRMIVASFLTKDLLIDWRWGEKYFMQKLVDGDMAANNGGWQWSASTGTDAQPYFRIFNPISQSKKFDAEGKFIKKFVPELKNIPEKYIHNPAEILQSSPLLQSEWGVRLGIDYPFPIVNHEQQREKALKMFKKAAEQKI